MINKAIKKLEIDSHIAYSLMLRLWSIFAGAFLVLLIPHTLTKVQQGFYFTFSSLLATQVFFELGLNAVLTQMVGHEAAHLQMNKTELSGPKRHINRLNSLYTLMRRIYKIMAVLFFIASFVGGFVFFNNQGVDNGNEWMGVWPLLTLFTGINLYWSPFLSSLEGMGFVAKISQVRLVQSVVGYLILWGCLLANMGLKSMIAIPACGALITSFWILKNYKALFYNNAAINPEDQVSWKTEIFPFQWRIALSWLSGYFIFQLFNPIIFSKFGAEAAGKIGLALTIFTTIGAFSFSWVSAKLPQMTHLVALSKIKDLHSLFWKVSLRSSVLNFLCCVGFVIAIELSKIYYIKIGDRFPDIIILCLLSIVSFVNSFIFSAASFMRAYKKEPLLYNSVTCAILSIIGIYLGSLRSVETIFIIYTFISVTVSLPWTIFVFKKFYCEEVSL